MHCRTDEVRPPICEAAGVELVSDRSYHFAVPPRVVWATLAATNQYRAWWPWLREFDASDLAVGQHWRCEVRPPLPYSLRFVIELVEVDEPYVVAAVVDGDITGTARIEIGARRGGSDVHFTSRLAPARGSVGLIARCARPVVRRGHDWVLDTGARQFASRALA